MTLTVDDLREHVESSLTDTELGRLLDAAYETIDHAIGPGGDDDYPATITEVLTVGPGDLFMLSAPASAILSVSESRSAPTTLATDDYQLIGSQLVKRLRDGTHARTGWHQQVTVSYTALADENRRDVAAIALVNLELTYQPGVQSEKLGDHSVTYSFGGSGASKYQDERAAILASLSGGFVAR